MPHFLNRNGDTELEAFKEYVNDIGYDIEGLTAALEARGHFVSVIGGETSGLSVIQIEEDCLVGGGDKRRDGTVSGSGIYYEPVAKGKGKGYSVSSIHILLCMRQIVYFRDILTFFHIFFREE